MTSHAGLGLVVMTSYLPCRSLRTYQVHTHARHWADTQQALLIISLSRRQLECKKESSFCLLSVHTLFNLMASSEGKLSDVHADRGPIDY
jgi:hypothetical protein